ncbi:PPC domain-containing protein [Sorangium sp. So ce375]|uniref:PPC domain-containing protein n=1 Tax=Sorangium sp. So ce375 TaxID=3133306 RepID=UPI003F5C7891
MKSMYFLGFFVLGTFAATAAGCGGDDEGGGGSGGEGGAGSTTTSSATTGAVTGSTSTGSGEVDDGNDSRDEAEPIQPGNNGIEGTLEPPEEDVDYYSFTGTKGEAVYILTDAKPSDDERDPTYPDTVITLFDAEGNQLAQNDDSAPGFVNDSELVTVLPADGEYFIAVQECNAVYPEGCGDPADIVSFDYSLWFLPVDPAESETDSLIGDTEPNDDSEHAVQLHYALNNDESGYFTTFAFGNFASATDVDVYSFTPPETPAVDHEILAQLSVAMPTGIEGNGSTVDVSEIAVFASTDLTNAYAKVDPSKGGDIALPVEAGQEYFVFVKRPAGEVGKNDFYILLNSRASSDPLEAQEETNGVVETPEGDLVSFQNGGGGVSYAIEGQIADGETADVDIYAVPLDDVEEGWTFSVICEGQRNGSGVRELSAEVLNGDGTPIDTATHSATETEDEDLYVQRVAIPAGSADNRLLVKVSAGTPAADVTSRGYNCLFAYLPPQTN